MLLSKIFDHAPEIEITGLSIDSRTVQPNNMYFCMDGLVHDGHEFIDTAIHNGAVCIIHEKDIENMLDDIVYIKVENVNRTLNIIASKFYDHPSRKLFVFGITGTNGKSSVATIIKDAYSQYRPCGYIGTISICYGNVSKPPQLTTPDAISIHKTMHEMVEHGVQAVALEVSSHGLELGRVQSVDFDIAVFTNLTYDHLDFHGTFENYFEAKKKLFCNLKESGVAILNGDDPYYEQLKDATNARCVSYGIKNFADYQADQIRIGTTSSSFILRHDEQAFEVHTNLVALYNIYNLLGAMAAMVEAGVPIEDVVRYVSDLPQIEGRMERIDEGQPFNVIVDFAHTPDGLEKVFEYAKTITAEDRSIITVFGSAGKRDAKKRKVFGEIASHFCDMIILTEDDPRDESAREIANEIRSGITNTNNIFIENRYDAIRQAIESANVGDTVLVLGKGDEIFMYREHGREAWIGDHVAARRCIRKYYLGIDDDNEEKSTHS